MDTMRNRRSVITISVAILFGLAAYAVYRKPGLLSSFTRSTAPTTTGTDRASSTPKAPVIDEKTQWVIADLVARWDTLRAFSASVATELPTAAGKPGTTKGQGTYEWAKRDDELLLRFGLLNTLRIARGDAKFFRTNEMLVFVYDGEFLYSQLHQPKFKKTTKSPYEPDRVLQIGGRELFRSLSETNSLKLVGEEMVDGRAVHIIEATPIGGAGNAVHYFDKQTGARLKMIERDETGKAKLTLTLSDLHTNPEFSEDHFTYKLPEGFELMDETHAGP
jgi:hypothetical protein